MAERIQFDRKLEGERRRGIRKTLEQTITKELKEDGFNRLEDSNSKWVRQREGDITHLFYLQRSYLEHAYYLEVGVLDNQSLPKGKKPDVVYCSGDDRARIEGVIREVFQKDYPDRDPKPEINKIRQALIFDVEGAWNLYPGELAFPAASDEQIAAKMAVITEMIGKYVPRWFEIHPEPRKQMESRGRTP